MRKHPICICIAVIIINYVEAGVITNAPQMRDTNQIHEGVQYSESDNDIREEFELRKKPIYSAKPVVYVKGLNKMGRTLDIVRDTIMNRDEDRMKKISSVITRVQNMLEINTKWRYNKVEALPMFAELHKNEDEQNENSIEDIVEISLPDDEATTDDNLSPNENDFEADNDNKKDIEEFFRSRTVIPTKGDCNSYNTIEEKKDLDEFMFMPDSNDLEDDVTDDGDVETTTPKLVIEKRLKRGVNMIEEENMGTTVSGFKFTGHDKRLSNDLYFKNINS